MATTTPNYGWPVPTSTDLVKNGATAIEALGDAIDGAFVDLKGGTTGQVLSKTSNTDMDFTWVAQDDSNAIQNSIVNAKGDLIGASANDVPAILSVGSNGETLVADSSTATGLRYTGNYAAGKSKIINGDFSVWQRGTTVAATGTGYFFNADRWVSYSQSGASSTASRQTFTPGTAPVAGYEGQYFYRIIDTANSCTAGQRIENVQTFAGQTATLSFWAKSASNVTGGISCIQNFGAGGSTQVYATLNSGGSPAFTTSWQRFTVNISVPSIAGKTIGAGSYLFFDIVGGANNALDIWGVQVEAGSVATAFQTATGTIQGETSACQRYFNRLIDGINQPVATLQAISTTDAIGTRSFPEMRVGPTVTYTTVGDLRLRSATNTALTVTGSNAFNISRQAVSIFLTVASGIVAGNATEAYAAGSNARLDLSAEL